MIARKLYLSALLLVYTILALAQYTPATVPNTKLVNNSYVSDPDGLIGESGVAQLNSVLSDLENQTTAQIAIVAVRSIGDYSDADFSQELFNLWGIGGSNSNGLLILVVDNPHVLRFHTGYGLEGALPDALCKQIQRDYMLPLFREGNYSQGLIDGINEIDKILTDPAYTEEIIAKAKQDEGSTYDGLLMFCLILLGPSFLITWAVKGGRFSNSKEPSPTEFPQMRLKRITWLIEFGGIPALILFLFSFVHREDSGPVGFVTIYLYLMATIVHRLVREGMMIRQLKEERKYYDVFEYLRQSSGYWWFIAIVFPVPFVLYLPFHYVRRAYYRNYPRKCQQCEGAMFKLSEAQEDEYLTKSQQLEESLKSVNYDVWKCKACGTTEWWHYKNRHTSYKECPSCKAMAYHLVHSKTIKHATYSSDGTGESLYQCKACNNSKREQYTIAQLVHSTPSSSSSSSSSSSHSDSNSSSGGSWGGGSSGGGGASSTW